MIALPKFFASLLFICFLQQSAVAQSITIRNADFQAGPFGQGSTIGVPINMSGCFRWNNTIRLYLCSPANTAGTLIGTYQNGSFSTFINGRVPNGIPAGTTYYVEARTDFPTARSNASTTFEIRNVVAPVTMVNAVSANRRLIDSLFYGYCSGSPSTPRSITLANQSTAGSVSTLQYKDESTGAITNLNLPIGNTTNITLDVTYYTLYTRADKDGVISTRYFFLVNPTHNTGIGQSGELRACLPDPLRVAMDTTSSSLGIKRNFPGSYFVFDWGDTAPNDTLTHCEINAMGGIVPHVYTDNSCNKTAQLGSQTIRNAYPIDIRYINPFMRPGNPNNCDGPVNAAFARIFRKPVADFISPERGCVNQKDTLINTTVAGVALAGDICSPAEEYQWYMNGVLVSTARDLVYTWPSTGDFEVRLVVENASCAPSEKIKHICVEAMPVVNFKVNGLDSVGGCADLSVNIDNQSGGITCGLNWKWRVYNDSTGALVNPASGVFTILPNDSAFQPQFIFHRPGRWRVELEVRSGCGNFRISKIVKVLGSSAFNFPAELGYCSTGMTINFGANQLHRPLYGATLGNETYLWTITGGAYSFQGGTSAISPYPIVIFTDIATYTLTLRYTTSCGITTKVQRIAFSQPVTSNAGGDTLSICYDQATVSLTGSTNGLIDSAVWNSTGSGSFSTPKQPNTSYTPSAADKTHGSVYLIYKAFAPAGSACGTVADSIYLKIFPRLYARDTTISVCSGLATNFTPVSSVPGSSFSWTSAVISGTVAGNTASGNGIINDVLTNTGPGEARVEYRITPRTTNCNGELYTLTVIIRPRPMITVIANPDTICTGETTVITLTGSPGILYSWTSAVTAGAVTGNTSGTAQPVTEIKNTLFNTGTSTATVTYNIVPQLSGCPGSAAIAIVAVLAGVSPANAGPDQFLCAAVQTSLNGNIPVRGSGNWRQLSGAPATIVNPADATTLVSGLQPDSIYRFIWQISGNGVHCGNSSDTIGIYVRKQTTVANAGPDSVSCVPNLANYALQGNSPAGYERGTWTIVNTTMNPRPVLQNANNANATISNLNLGTVTLRWTITSDATGCTATNDDVSITVGAVLFLANAGNDQVLCNATVTSLSGNSAAGTTGQWRKLPGSNAVINNPLQNNTSVSNLVPGQHSFVWSLNNGVCPPSYDTISITVLPEIQNDFTDTPRTICKGQRIFIGDRIASGGTGSYEYQWQQSSDNINFNDIPGATSATLETAPSVNTWYRRKVTSLPCIHTSTSVFVAVREEVSNNTISADQLICVNTKGAILNGSDPAGGYGAYSFSWELSPNGTSWAQANPGDSKDFDPGVVSGSTWYRRKVLTSFCQDIAPSVSNIVRINVNPDAKAAFDPHPTRGCPPLYINNAVLNPNFYSDRNSSWIWLRDGDIKSTGPVYPADTMFRVFDSTTVSLIAISRHGCKNDTLHRGFATGAPPTVELGTGDSVIAGTKVKLDPVTTNGPFTNYAWTPLNSGLTCYDCRSPEATVNFNVLYRLEVTNSFGCTASDTIRYRVYCDELQVYLPNIFSPDGDGINDIYMVRGKGLKNVSLRILNRWGQVVFQKSDIRPDTPADGWDGKVNGKVIQDVYIYVFEADCTKGGKFNRKGNITLILAK